ncbi:MAG: hypothetical protein EOO09_19070 [Chitinophagaceae bacterium]|nr:MAG: hypothetical protein EOO09_19070 [Chitinophagaceae bacterium]
MLPGENTGYPHFWRSFCNKEHKFNNMQWSIIWNGRENDSREHCLINSNDSGIKVDSVIIGKNESGIYRVEYALLLDQHWKTISLTASSLHNNIVQHLEYTSDGQGNWTDKGQVVERLQGCIDIDLPLTPFTNSLPVNRLNLAVGAESDVRVVYVDLLSQKISPLTQKYKRISADEYLYQNVPNDFEAVIKTDHEGFVLDYPELFWQSASSRLE